MQTVGWISILPPLLAIILAIRTKQIFFSLFLGIWLGWTILGNWNPLEGLRAALECCIRVFEDNGNTRVIAFSGLVGSLIMFIQRSGGVAGFINWLSQRGYIGNRKSASLLGFSLGIIIFIESSITSLVTGSVCRPIFDKLKIPREKLAYICDSTSAPICILMPLNGWGAFIIGLLAAQNIENPFWALLQSIPYNFYAIAAILILLGVILSGKDFGPMKEAEKRARDTGLVLREGAEPLISTEMISESYDGSIAPKAINMLLPIAAMVVMMPLGLFITGGGNIMQGSGSTSVLWAVLTGLVTGAILYKSQKIMSGKEITNYFFKGIGEMMPIALLMMLAFAIGQTCKHLGTGIYLAQLTNDWLSPGLVPATLFIVSAITAFSTGTSWGTFAIMVPLGVPIVDLMPVNLSMIVGAILSGGIFGDHCSPISDTTIISSMASASDHIDHVKTQLPYALTGASITILLYLIFGFYF